MKNREDQRNKTKVDNSVNVFGEKFLDKYSVNIRDQIEKFSKKLRVLKHLLIGQKMILIKSGWITGGLVNL